MQKVINYLLILFVFIFTTSFTFTGKEKLKWMTVTEMQAAYKNNPKPILVDLYTDWCGWCKVMERETYQNEQVIKYINKNYYAIKLNAETQSSIEWGGKAFKYIGEYRVNELAVYLAQGRLAYPTTVLLASPDAQPAPFGGFLKPSQLESPLKYYGDNAFKTKTYTEFLKTFSATW